MAERSPASGEVDRERALDEAARLVARARRVLANGEMAMSARPLLFGEAGVYPQFITSADGCRLVDTTGRIWIDWVVGWGTALLGYRRPEIEAALRAQLAAAPTLTLPHALEVEVAERLVAMVPCAEMVAFGKNGSDAVTAAVRLARAATERDVVLHYGFHGFHDWFAAGDGAIRGLPAAFRGLVCDFPYNDLPALSALFERFSGQVAAVVMEPLRQQLPAPGYLEAVRDLAHRHGALLVFDEMITGLRLARGGAQQWAGVTPDLACFGKALSNGMPLSALCGPRELMRSADSVGVDRGCRGETLSLAAARAALDVHAAEPIAERVAAAGTALRAGVEAAAARERIPLRLVGHPARLEIEFEEVGRLTESAALGLFIQGCLDRGVVTNGLLLPTAAHDDQAIAATVSAASEALAIVARAARGDFAALPPPFGPRSFGFIDAATWTRGELELRGWLLPLAAPADEIELVDSAGATHPAALSLRPDVAVAHPEIAGAERSGWAVAWAPEQSPGATCTLRAWRAGRIVFRARIVVGLRDYPRALPRELGDGHVVEV